MLATIDCDMAAVRRDGVNTSPRNEGHFYPRGRLSGCVGRGLGLGSLSTATGLPGGCLQLSVVCVAICQV